MKTTIAFLAILLSSSAYANTYECFAKANTARGFDFDFSISVEPAAVGGQILFKIDEHPIVLGTVSEVGSIRGADPAQKAAFDATLGLIWEEDVSGIAEPDLNRVNLIEIFRAQLKGDDEALVYKLMDGDKQIGGTVLISGNGTACLP
jgi:hypothetical protein